MFHRWAALVLVLALCAMSPKNAAGQTVKKPRSTSGGLGQNYPNPFNPETRIPIVVGDTTNNCADDRQQHVVTVKIFNLIGQLSAVPTLLSEATAVTSSAPPALSGAPFNGLRLACGVYTAYWSGNVLNTGKEAASGMYLVVLTIDGQPGGSRHIFNKK